MEDSKKTVVIDAVAAGMIVIRLIGAVVIACRKIV